jgi:multidrug efflux system membrane fusion protein
MVSAGSAPVTLVPEQALGTDLGKRFVLVLDAGKHVQYREVVLGPAVGELRVVRSGLASGDVIVVTGLNKVKPGDPVTPVRAAIAITPADEAALEPAAFNGLPPSRGDVR